MKTKYFETTRAIVLWIVVFAAISCNSYASSLPHKENAYLNDFVHIFNRSEQRELCADIKSLCDKYSTSDNGMLALVKPKSAFDKAEVMILTISKSNDYFWGVKQALFLFLCIIEFSEMGLIIVSIIACIAIMLIVVNATKKRARKVRVEKLKEKRDLEEILEAMKGFNSSSCEYKELKAVAKRCGATLQQLKEVELISNYAEEYDATNILMYISNAKSEGDFVYWENFARNAGIDNTSIRLAELSRQKKLYSSNVDKEVCGILKMQSNNIYFDKISKTITSLGLSTGSVANIFEDRREKELDRMKEDAKNQESLLGKLGEVAAVVGGIVVAKKLIDKKRESKTKLGS